MDLIRYVHNDLISDLELFHISDAIIKARTFIFDTNVVVSVTFRHKIRVLLDSWICNYTPTQHIFDFEWYGSDMNW